MISNEINSLLVFYFVIQSKDLAGASERGSVSRSGSEPRCATSSFHAL